MPRHKNPAYTKSRRSDRDYLRCLICGGLYKHIGSHVVQKHKMTAREYKIKFNLPLKKGLIVKSVAEKMRANLTDEAIAHVTKAGEKTRYKKGDERTKKKTGWKSTGSKPFPKDGSVPFERIKCRKNKI